MTQQDEGRVSRRALICLACAVPVLTACGADANEADKVGKPGPDASGSSTPTSSPSADTQSEKGTEEPAASEPAASDPTRSAETGSEETSAPAPAATKPAGALVKTSDVPVGGGVVLSSAGIVVTQPNTGTFKGFTNICTHQGCGVGRVSGGNIICPCHGSEFSIVNGSVTNGPARTPLAAKSVTVKSGWVCKA